jgi:hypothetical protein
MGLANEMKKMSEEILGSYKKRAAEYQQRLKENEELVFEVQKTLDGFRKNHLEMAANLHANAATLRANLTQGEVARLNAFSNLMNGIRDSISTIQKEVEDIQHSTADLLIAFSASRGEMAEDLEETFAEARAGRAKQNQDRETQNQDRLKDFDALMKNIQADVSRSKADVKEILTNAQNLVSKFSSERAEMSVNLRNDLNTNLEERVAFTRTLLKTFHERLAEISKENQQMAEELKNKLLQSRTDLSASDVKRMKDFDQSMGAIRNRVSEIQSSIANLINNLSADRMQAAAEWQGLSDAIAQIKNSSTTPPKSAPVATPKDVEPKKEEEIIEKEPEKEKKQTFDFPKDMSLEEKVIMYVNAHPEGVKVSDMEEPLGEQRMRIGYVSKKLMDGGKLTKLENAYFPKAKGEKKKK